MPTETRESCLIRVPNTTREKIRRIAAVKRWNIQNTVDLIADHFIATDPNVAKDKPLVGQRLDVSA